MRCASGGGNRNTPTGACWTVIALSPHSAVRISWSRLHHQTRHVGSSASVGCDRRDPLSTAEGMPGLVPGERTHNGANHPVRHRQAMENHRRRLGESAGGPGR